MWFLGNPQIWQNKKRDRYNFLSLTTATTRRFRGNKHHYCNDDVKTRKGRRRSWHFGKFPDVIFSNIPTNKTINQSVVKTQSTLEILNYNMCISHLPILRKSVLIFIIYLFLDNSQYTCGMRPYSWVWLW